MFIFLQDDLHIIGLVTAVLACIMECCKLPDVCGREQLITCHIAILINVYFRGKLLACFDC